MAHLSCRFCESVINDKKANNAVAPQGDDKRFVKLEMKDMRSPFIDAHVKNVGQFMTKNSCLPVFRWSASRHYVSETQ